MSPFRVPIHNTKIPSPSPQTQTNTLRLRAVGDVMLGRKVAVEAEKRHDWKWPFAGTTPFLPPADALIGNLETPIIKHCPLTSTGMTFCAPAKAIDGLTYAGFSVLSLANNHTTNYGYDGFTATKQLLTDNQIVGLGDYETTTITTNNIKVGFLALNDTFIPINASRAGEIISDLKQQADIVVVMPHWGNEYEFTPSVHQQQLAKKMTDAGATIILGAHPHVLQPVVVQNNSLIAYSLGNFVFDQMWSDETRKGMILDMEITLTNHQVSAINYQQHPTTIFDYGQPRLDINK